MHALALVGKGDGARDIFGLSRVLLLNRQRQLLGSTVSLNQAVANVKPHTTHEIVDAPLIVIKDVNLCRSSLKAASDGTSVRDRWFGCIPVSVNTVRNSPAHPSNSRVKGFLDLVVLFR